MIILDTSVIIDYFKDKKARKEEMLMRRFFSDIKILDFGIKASEESSEVMARLLSIGKTINTLDVLIAGIAITNGADKIVSRDKDFLEIGKVTGLEIEVY
jgi:tRNA(fMet)-specific endonuclease VapC